MRVVIYGVFLLTGEAAPVEARLRRSATARVGRAVDRALGRPARVSVTLSAVLLRDGEIFTRCEIRGFSSNGSRLVVAAIGPTAWDALDKSISRLLKTSPARAISAPVPA
jgi:hypothetical protein